MHTSFCNKTGLDVLNHGLLLQYSMQTLQAAYTVLNLGADHMGLP